MNEQVIKGKWREIKGEVQKLWGKLTDDELEKTKGDVKSIAGLVQQHYGHEKESFNSKFDGIVKKFTDAKDKAMEDTKERIKN